MRLLNRWIWPFGALVTLTASIFVLLTMDGVRDTSRVAGDIGRLRAYALEAHTAYLSGGADAALEVIEGSVEHAADVEPAVHALDSETIHEAFHGLSETFQQLGNAARADDGAAVGGAARDVTGQVDELLALLADQRDAAVHTVRTLAFAGAGLTVLGAGAGLLAGMLANRRMTILAVREARATRRYEELVASMQNGILVTDEAGCIAYCNRTLADMFGYEMTELTGRPAKVLLGDGQAPGDKHGRPLAGGQMTPPTLTRCVARDGSRRDVVIAVTPIMEGGRCVATLCEFRNVTQELALQQQVDLEVTKGEGIMDVAPVPLVVIDESGCVIASNPAVEEALGWPSADLVGRNVSVLMPEPFASNHDDYVRHYLRTGEASTEGGLVVGRERPTFALHRAGHQVPISLRVAESRTVDGRRLFTGAIHDLTRQSTQESERLRLLESLMHTQRDVALGAMVGGVAHDFNNLLTAIVGALDLEISARGQSSRWLDHASVAARRASAVVRRLLQSTRPGDAALYPTSSWDVLQENVELARETFDRRITLQVHHNGPLPLVLADSTRLGQVYLNLLLNARDAVLARAAQAGPGFTPEIRVAAGGAIDSMGREVVRAIFSDNGVGIPTSEQERIFDPFYSSKPEGQGSGLGLTMVKAIIHELHGTIEMDSHEGVGSTFTIDLPSLGSDFVDPRPAAEVSTPTTRILVVDDEEIVREVAATALQRHRYEVITANSGESALDILLLDGDIDLVLLDLNMPGIGGWETLSRIRERYPRLPVVIVSGTVRSSEAIQRGAAGAMEKPFDLNDLLQLVRQHTDRARGDATREPASR